MERTSMMLRALRVNRRAQSVVRVRYAPRATQKMCVATSRWSPVLLKPAALSFMRHGCRLLSTKPVPSSDCLQSALARTRTVPEVLEVWEAHRESVYSHNVVRSCLYYSLKAAESQRLSSAKLFEVPGFGRFWRHLVEEVPSMSANSAIKCLYNCAQFHFNHTSLSASLVDVCTQKSQTIPSVSIGILLWSLKRLNLLSSSSSGPLLTHLIDLLQSKLVSGERFKPQSLANILWALASTDSLPNSLSQKVTQCLPGYLEEFDFHSLSLCLWSLTTGGAVLTPSLLDSAGLAAARFLQKEKSVPNTVHCCWAFASAGYYHQSFCVALSQLVLGEPGNSPLLTPRFLSSVAWMCAKVAYFDPALLDCIASRALPRLRHFNAQDLGNLMYAYAQLNYSHHQLVREVTDRFVSDGRLLRDDDACVSIAWANLAMGEYPLPLLDHLMQPHRVRRLIEAGDQNSLNFLLRLQVLQRAERPDLHLSLPHHLAVFAGALALCRWFHPHSKLLDSVVSALSSITCCSDSSYFTLEALTTTLYFIDIEIMLDDRGNPIPVPNHWRSWEDLQSFIDSPCLARHSPGLQALLQDTSGKLASGGAGQKLSLASDWAELVGGPVGGVARRVAMEVDGPWHYAANCPHTLGKTLLKHRILRCHGWTVVSVPYFEWQELENKQAQVDFLRTKLFTIIDH